MSCSSASLVCKIFAEVAAPFEHLGPESFRPKLKRTQLHALCGCLPSLFVSQNVGEEMRHQASDVEKLRVCRPFTSKVREDLMPKLYRARVVRHACYKRRISPMHPCKEEQMQRVLSVSVSGVPTGTKSPVCFFHTHCP
jgi:hypothetical protein